MDGIQQSPRYNNESSSIPTQPVVTAVSSSKNPTEPPQQTPPHLTDFPEPSKKSLIKKVIMLGISFLLIAILIIGLYYLYALLTSETAQEPSQLIVREHQSPPSPTASPIPTPENSTANTSVSGMEVPTGEGIEIDKPLSIVGEVTKGTIIECVSDEDIPFTFTKSYSTLANMTIRNCKYGVKILATSEEGVEEMLFYNVVFENNKLGGILIESYYPNAPMSFEIQATSFIGGSTGVVIDFTNSSREISKIENSIFYNQTVAPINIISESDNGVKYSYNLFYNCGEGRCNDNWYKGKLNSLSSETNNIFDLDPLFADPTRGNFNLTTESPAIDSGDPTILTGFEFDGNFDGMPRIDIGAIEFIQ